MNIDSSGITALFSSGDDLTTGRQPLGGDAEATGNFADALKEQIKQLSNMKEIAENLKEEGFESEFSTFFGNELPITNLLEKEVDIEHTIEALENVLNSIEHVATEEINLESRLQQLIDKTDSIKTDMLGSFELEEKVTRLAEELQKIQNFVSQSYTGEISELGLTGGAELLVTHIDDITKELKLVRDTSPLNEIVSPDTLNTLEQVQTQIAAIIPTLNDSLEHEQISNLVLPEIKQEIKKESLVVGQRASEVVLGETETLLPQENTFRKPGQTNPVFEIKHAETVQISEDIDLSNNEKIVPKFAADLAMLNKAVITESKDALSPMTKHFAHPEWSKEMGERILWMHKQAIPSAELRLNPRHLGPITIKIDVTQDQATVAFTAQHAVVKEAIEAAMPKLREMFSAQQLNLADVTVSQDETGQRQSKSFAQMGNGQESGQSNQSETHGNNEQESDLMGIAEEIEAGRAIASNGLLSIFA